MYSKILHKLRRRDIKMFLRLEKLPYGTNGRVNKEKNKMLKQMGKRVCKR